MPSPVIEVLEKHGLVSSDSVEKLSYKLPFKEVSRIRDELELSLPDSAESAEKGDSLSPFNFLASASFRGEIGCASWPCHVLKAQTMARYASLFCDRLIVPVNISSHRSDCSQSDQRFSFARELLSLVELRPAIDAGIVFPVRSAHCFCPFCSPELVPEADRIIAVKQKLQKTFSSMFNETYVPGTNARPGKIRTTGPDEFIEHPLNTRLKQIPEWLPQAFRARAPFDLTEQQKERFGFIRRLFARMAVDIAAQQAYGAQFNAAYLTDRAGEANFLLALNNEDQLAARTANLCAQLTHSVPLFMDLPVAAVIRIRKEDYEAFESYRATLSKLLREHVAADSDLNPRQAKELFADVLEPEILNLQQMARNERKRAATTSAIKYGAMAGVVAFGAYSGLLPAHLREICAAMGGMKLVEGLADSLISIEKDPTKVRNSNLYFLLRLKQERDLLQ